MSEEWDPAPPTSRQRIAAGVFLLVFGLVLGNEYFRWGLVGDYGQQMIFVAVLIGVIMMTYFMPSTRRR
jgi:hypothetical protein